MKLAPKTSKHCKFAVTGGNMNGYYRFLKAFYGPADRRTILQEKIDRTLRHQIPVGSTTLLSSPAEQRKNTPENKFGTFQNRKRRIPGKQKNRNFTKKKQKARTHNITKRHQTKQRNNRRNQQIETPQTSKL